MAEIKKGELIIYKASEGPELSVKLENDTVWMTQAQISTLFGTQRPAITKHLRNIYKTQELSEKSVCSILEHTAQDGKKYKVQYYNLDAIIAVGYRVNSKKATQFRVWATQTLRDYLLKGYIIDKKRLQQLEAEHVNLKELEQANKLIRQVLEAGRESGYEKELLKIITDYTNTWFVLNQYDKNELGLEHVTKKKASPLVYEELRVAIDKFKQRLGANKEAGELFGQEVGEKFKAILGNIYQTFDGDEVYPSLEEKASHLLYFMIKDHPFTDGNKRIGSLVFLLFLVDNHYLYNKRGERKINDSALAALALLIAESRPEQKETMVRLIINLINRT